MQNSLALNFIGTLAFLMTSVCSANPDPEQLKAAVQALPACQNFVRFDDQYVYAGFDSGKLYLAKLSDASSHAVFTSWQLPEASIDVLRLGNALYVLDPQSLEEWDITQGKLVARYPTYDFSGNFDQYETPSALAAYGDKIVISHGSLGVSVFDTTAKRIIFQTKLVQFQLPLESTATGVTVQGNKAYILLDSLTLVTVGKPPFRGLVVLNLDTLQIEATLDGLDPGADSISSYGDKLLVSFMGDPIWKYGIGDLNLTSSQLPNPERRIFEFPVAGNPTGKASMDSKYYYTCYEKQPMPGASFRSLPMVLDRTAMQM